MSATELIEQVAALSHRERMEFEALFDAMKNGRPASAPAERSNWPDFGERLFEIYGGKIAPDSQMIVDDARGDR